MGSDSRAATGGLPRARLCCPLGRCVVTTDATWPTGRNRPPRTLSLIEWLDNGDFVQRALGAMQLAAIKSGSVLLEVPPEE